MGLRGSQRKTSRLQETMIESGDEQELHAFVTDLIQDESVFTESAGAMGNAQPDAHSGDDYGQFVSRDSKPY